MHHLFKTVSQEVGIGLDQRLNPYTAAALSVVPGLGQLYNGQKAKAFLFMDVAFVNFCLLAVILLAKPISRGLQAISTEFHARANYDLILTLKHIAPGSTVSNIVLLLVLSFFLYVARDAYDTARTRKLKAIYPDAVISMAEAASGSYLMHLSMMFTCALLALFLIIPAPPRPDVSIWELVPPSKPATPPKDTHKISTVSSNGNPRKQIEQDHHSSSQTAPAHHQSQETPHQSHAAPPPAAPRNPAPPATLHSVVPPVVKPLALPQIRPVLTPHTPAAAALPTPIQPIAPRPFSSNAAPPLHSQAMQVAALPTPVHPNLPQLSVQPAPTAVALDKSSLPANLPQPGALSHHNSSSFSGAPQPMAVSSGTNNLSTPTPGVAPSPSHSAAAGTPGSSGPTPSKITNRIAFGGLPLMPKVGPGTPGPASDNPGAGTGPRTVVGADPSELRTGPGRDPGGVAKRNLDWGPYMANLQRRIKSQWMPQRYPNSNRVMVEFNISRSGELSGLRLTQSSGSPVVDEAAMQAVRNSAPFPPLPQGAEEKVLIQFTFDYNVFGGSSHAIRF